MKYLYLLPLIIFFGCATKSVTTVDNQKWLKAAQHVATVNNNTVSTADSTKSKLFVKWAKENGYKVKVSNRAGSKSTFIVVSK